MKMEKKADSKVDWLARDMIEGPYLCLVLSQEEYEDAMRDLGISLADAGVWINPGYNGLVQTYRHKNGTNCNVVSIANHEGRGPIEVAGILVHEAVHVFQSICEMMGEHSPSKEFEAYSIQVIAMRLMSSYERKIKANAVVPEEPAR